MIYGVDLLPTGVRVVCIDAGYELLTTPTRNRPGLIKAWSRIWGCRPPCGVDAHVEQRPKRWTRQLFILHTMRHKPAQIRGSGYHGYSSRRWLFTKLLILGWVKLPLQVSLFLLVLFFFFIIHSVWQSQPVSICNPRFSLLHHQFQFSLCVQSMQIEREHRE